MEGKFAAMLMTVLMMSLLMVQIQVEAKICCPSQNARTAYTICDYTPKIPQFACLLSTGCKKVNDDGRCPSGSIYSRLENSGDAVNEYCKLGCASSVCSAMTTLRNSDGTEIVAGAVENCTKACSIFCTKGFVKPALETA
ncbi:PREDICTED: thionin-2.2-like [Camelina sativa]|uniref:Thionin-2.2-like n=1 Tax=Camelina sativa TaxID=90675 RepID=A0ABM0TGC0_CAMSA|nr:PREDICTED: thionin-2.2-like [Camelina sativa]